MQVPYEEMLSLFHDAGAIVDRKRQIVKIPEKIINYAEVIVVR